MFCLSQVHSVPCMFYFQLFIRVVCRFNVGRRPVPPWGGKEAPGGGRREIDRALVAARTPYRA